MRDDSPAARITPQKLGLRAMSKRYQYQVPSTKYLDWKFVPQVF
jgi:hypothetical protein